MSEPVLSEKQLVPEKWRCEKRPSEVFERDFWVIIGPNGDVWDDDPDWTESTANCYCDSMNDLKHKLFPTVPFAMSVTVDGISYRFEAPTAEGVMELHRLKACL